MGMTTAVTSATIVHLLVSDQLGGGGIYQGFIQCLVADTSCETRCHFHISTESNVMRCHNISTTFIC